MRWPVALGAPSAGGLVLRAPGGGALAGLLLRQQLRDGVRIELALLIGFAAGGRLWRRLLRSLLLLLLFEQRGDLLPIELRLLLRLGRLGFRDFRPGGLDLRQVARPRRRLGRIDRLGSLRFWRFGLWRRLHLRRIGRARRRNGRGRRRLGRSGDLLGRFGRGRRLGLAHGRGRRGHVHLRLVDDGQRLRDFDFGDAVDDGFWRLGEFGLAHALQHLVELRFRDHVDGNGFGGVGELARLPKTRRARPAAARRAAPQICTDRVLSGEISRRSHFSCSVTRATFLYPALVISDMTSATRP